MKNRNQTKGRRFVCGCVLSGVGYAFASCSAMVERPRQQLVRYDDPSERPDLLSYSKASTESLQKIKVKAVSLTGEELRRLAALPKTKTAFAVRWFVVDEPDTMRAGPWTTRVYITDSADTNQYLRVELFDHSSGGIHLHWLNDKMLFVNVWWGRVAWTDFLLDTETHRVPYIEDGRIDAMVDWLKQKEIK